MRIRRFRWIILLCTHYLYAYCPSLHLQLLQVGYPIAAEAVIIAHQQGVYTVLLMQQLHELLGRLRMNSLKIEYFNVRVVFKPTQPFFL